MPIFISRRSVLLAIPAIIVAAGVATAGFFMSPVPDGLDLSMAKMSEGGLYHAELSPEAMPITVGQMHAWELTIQTADGEPLDNGSFVIDGGMPQHGHGLPTTPQITQNLGEGRYVIEGVKFNMDGWWTFEIAIEGAAGADTVTFNLML